MPTATDVDNRPVAIGKWPRLRRNGHAYPIALRRQQPHTQNSNNSTTTHKDWCTLENCVHSCDESSNICTDVLLQPELLQELYGDRSKYLISFFLKFFHKLPKYVIMVNDTVFSHLASNIFNRYSLWACKESRGHWPRPMFGLQNCSSQLVMRPLSFMHTKPDTQSITMSLSSEQRAREMINQAASF